MWIFGDEYGVVIMKNYAINLIVERQAKTWTSYTAAEMTLVYEKTPVGSPLRRLTSNFIPLTVPLGTDIHAHLSGSCANTWPHEYLVFLACALSARSEKFNPLTKVSMMRLHRCAYHEHPRGILCTTTKVSSEASLELPKCTDELTRRCDQRNQKRKKKQQSKLHRRIRRRNLRRTRSLKQRRLISRFSHWLLLNEISFIQQEQVRHMTDYDSSFFGSKMFVEV